MADPLSSAWWLPYVQPFGTVILGLSASAIAIRQWLTSREKLRLDAFTQRAQIFNEIVRHLDSFVSQPELLDRFSTIRSLKTGQLLLPFVVLDDLEILIFHFSKIPDARGELMKDQDVDRQWYYHSEMIIQTYRIFEEKVMKAMRMNI